MRHATLLLLAALALVTPEVMAQCTGTAGTDFQEVTLREVNTYSQSTIDQLNAGGASLTIPQIQDLLTNDFEGERIQFTAVLLTDPFKSGIRSLNAQGIPGGIHTFVRDVAAATEGVEGMGVQLVDFSGSGQLQNFFPGDEVTVCGDVEVFEGSGGVAMQIALESMSSTGVVYAEDDALRQPVVITTDDIHDAVDANGETKTQIDWSVYGDYNNQYVRFEEIEMLQAVPGARVDALFSSPGQDTQINLYDTSVCFRNDRGEDYFPANQAPACIDEDFLPPPSGIINLQGFLVFQGDDGTFDYAAPDGANFVINPIEEDDFEIAVAPPIVDVAAAPIATSTDGATISATILPGTDGNTVATVVADYTTSSGQSGQVTLSNTSGDDYEGTITGLTAGDFVTYTITATDNRGAASETDPISRRVIDGAVSSIFDIQATPDGGAGGSGLTTADPVEFDLDATVQSAFMVGSNFFATIQDDPSLGPFTGVWVFLGSTDPSLEPGDQITITEARVQEQFGLTQLTDVTFTETGSGDILGYKEVTTDLINNEDGTDAAEQHEGMLLSFPNASIVATNADDPAGPFGEFTFASGGNALRADDFSSGLSYAGNDPASVFTVGETFEFIRGPLYYSFSNFKLAPVSFDDIGTQNPVSVGSEPGDARVAIESAFPNPTAGAVRVRFSLATAGPATLRVFDTTGRQVATLAEGDFGAASTVVTAELDGLAAGVYVLRLEAGGEVATSRIAIVR